MKKVLDKTMNTGYKILLMFTILCFSIGLIGSVFFYVNRSYNYLNPVILIIGSIIYLFFIIKLYRFMIKLSEKAKIVICIILLILQFILLFTSSCVISSVPKVDLVHILTGINSLNHTGNIINSEYFSVYPNNKFLLIILYNVQRLSPNHAHVLFSLLSSFSITIMSFFTYKIVKCISDINKGLISLFICVFSPIFYLYVSYYYTDILMLPFASILLYLIIKSKDNKKLNLDIIFGLLIGIVAIIGYKIRAVSIFLLIAYFVYLIISRNIMVFIKKAIPIIIFASLTFFSINKIENDFFVNSDSSKKYPMTHWIMMGLNGKQHGYYSHDDYILSGNEKDVNNRKKANIREIKRRVKENGPIGMTKLSIAKLVSVWAKGDYSYQKYLELVNDYNRSYLYLLEDKNIVINYLLQFSKIVVLFLAIISLCLILKENKKSIVAISLFGSVAFYLIWEVCPRYGLSFLPWLIILGSYSYDFLTSKILNEKYNGNKLKCALLTISILLLLLGFNKYTKLDLRENVVSKDTAKKNSYENLNKYTTITQSLKLNSSFNKIKLRFVKSQEISDSKLYKLELLDSNENLKYFEYFNDSDVIKDDYTIFNLPKNYKKGTYYIRLSTESENDLKVITAFKEEYDFYPSGALKINGVEQKGDLLFEITNIEKRGIYTYGEYILIVIITISIEYFVLFKGENNKLKYKGDNSTK